MSNENKKSPMDEGTGKEEDSPVRADSPAEFTPKSLAAVLILVCIAGTAVYFSMKDDTAGESSAQTYSVKDLGRIDKGSIQFKELSPVPTGLKEPTCIAAGPDGRIYAGGDRQICVFDMGGKKVRQLDLQETPKAVAVNAINDILVGFPSHVTVYNAGNEKTKEWTFNSDSIITGIAVSGSKVFIADAGKKVVHMRDFANPATEVDNIGASNKEKGDDGLVIYSGYLDVIPCDNDLLAVVDPGRHRIKFYSQAGELVYAWKSNSSTAIEGFAGCCNPAHIALFPDGRIITSEKAIPRIKMYSPGGDFICVVAGPDSFKEGQLPCDIAVDGKGVVYAIDPGTGNIRIFAFEHKVK